MCRAKFIANIQFPMRFSLYALPFCAIQNLVVTAT